MFLLHTRKYDGVDQKKEQEDDYLLYTSHKNILTKAHSVTELLVTFLGV